MTEEKQANPADVIGILTDDWRC